MVVWNERLDAALPTLDRIASKVGLTVKRRDYDLRLVDASAREIVRRVEPFTMTDHLAIVGLIDAIDHIERAGVPGAVVECGVWRGGSSMAAALRLLGGGPPQRELWLYDTFEGMTAPSDQDVRNRDGLRAVVEFDRKRRSHPDEHSAWYFADAPLEDVRTNLSSTGYPQELIRFVRGRVEETIPAAMPDSIALLRLDTDWYESTQHELEHLLPLVMPGGVLIVDDYHYWRGSRKAAEEYFASRGDAPLFSRIGSNGAVVGLLA